MKLYAKLLILAVCLCFSKHAFSSHLTGGNISYEHIENDTFLVTFTMLFDCGGTVDEDNTYDLDINSSCSNPISIEMDLVSIEDVSQTCDSSLTTCNNGSELGIKKITHTATVYLPPCADWELSVDIAFRNSVDNINSSQDFYIYTTLNSLIAPQNNSPEIASFEVPSVCIGQPTNLDFSSFDQDGDSLVYSLTCPLDDPSESVTFFSGFNCQNPLGAAQPITLDSTTGVLNFTPATAGTFVLAVKIEEYDENGALIGEIIKDLEIHVVGGCTNSAPDITAGAIQNLNGAQLIDSTKINTCLNNNVSFDLQFNDINPTDILYIESNITDLFPGATLNTTGTNPITVQVNFQTPVELFDQVYNILIQVKDGACPIEGIQSFAYQVFVASSTYAGPDQITCGPNTEQSSQAQLSAVNGTTFTWNVISGDPIVVGQNFSCNPCSNPIASPDNTTTYEVVSDLNASLSCPNKDTVTVTRVADFSYTTSSSSNLVCLGEEVQVNAQGSPAGNYTFNWSTNNGMFLSANDQPNTTLSYETPSISDSVFLAITSPLGCTKNTFEVINTSNVFQPNVIINTDSVICSTEQSTTLQAINAQECYIILNMFDSFGDGWNGCSLEINSATTSYGTFTINSGDFASDTIYISSSLELPLEFYFDPGSFVTETAFSVLDQDGNTLYIDNTLPGVYELVWSLNTLPCSNQDGYMFYWQNDNSLGQSDSFEAQAGGTYTLVASDSASICFDTTTVDVNLINSSNQLDITSDYNASSELPVSVQFTNNGPDVYQQYSWMLNNNEIATSYIGPSSTFSDTGQFSMVLTAYDENNCISQDSLSLTIYDLFYQPLGNAFSPGDENDFNNSFGLSGTGFYNYTLNIYSRWGREVFSCNVADFTKPCLWEGKNKQGNTLQEGVYYYVIEAEDILGQPITDESFKGTITLFR